MIYPAGKWCNGKHLLPGQSQMDKLCACCISSTFTVYSGSVSISFSYVTVEVKVICSLSLAFRGYNKLIMCWQMPPFMSSCLILDRTWTFLKHDIYHILYKEFTATVLDCEILPILFPPHTHTHWRLWNMLFLIDFWGKMWCGGIWCNSIFWFTLELFV